MIRVLCYGDSNTWGFDPESGNLPFPRRHSSELRWTGVARKQLGKDWELIEEGLNGRTTVHEDPLAIGRNGRDYLTPCLQSHQPLDIVVLMLGTNDLKTMFQVSPAEIAKGIEALVEDILSSNAGPNHAAPKILLVSPPIAGPFDHLPELEEKFAGAHDKSMRLAPLYQGIAESRSIAFLDAAAVAPASPLDGLHLDPASHRTLGEGIAEALTRLGS